MNAATLDDILKLIGGRSSPNGEKGPERYIEVQIWDEETINRFW